ncbi:hypothetical protein ACLGIH_07390 [Streptomyces sp. HMX87]|uniref:hypothetical protein n=1 Tax=Streptomyces sp. HMX87 TaxID=3390849 RepID=UPI003A8B82F9
MAGVDPIDEAEVIEHRGPFPTDNYARVCILQACVEIEACVSYGWQSRTSEDGLVRDVFLTIMKDEVQHRQYFASFAKALVESGVYPVKDVLSMAFLACSSSSWTPRSGCAGRGITEIAAGSCTVVAEGDGRFASHR